MGYLLLILSLSNLNVATSPVRDQLREGMSREDVVTYLGQPTSSETWGSRTEEALFWEGNPKCFRRCMVKLVRGNVKFWDGVSQ